MTKNLFSKPKLLIVFSMALFNFIFLGTEYLYDNMMAYVTDAQGVVVAQSYMLGASVLGFLLFPVLAKQIKNKGWNFWGFAITVVVVICIFVIQQHMSWETILVAGLIAFCLMGVGGSAVCFLTTQIVEDKRHLAKHVGVAYALGIFLQFLNNNLVKNDMVESIVISISCAVFVVLLLKMKEENDSREEVEGEDCKENIQEAKPANPTIAGISLILCVLLMTCIFSTLDNAVTLVHAAGSVDIGQWPRLLLAVSGLFAGVLYDLKNRKFMNLIMYVVTLLSTSCVVLIQMGGSFVVGLLVFYMSAGFFVVFFTTSFMDLSYSTKLPTLWAGLGRATNNLCAILTGTISTMLLATGNGMVIMIVALLMFAAISICIAVYELQLKAPLEKGKDEDIVTIIQNDGMSPEEKFAAFSEHFSLTDREQDVLKVLLDSDENIQDIAEQLAISRAALYRHIASLNEKTNTKTRIGILQFYYNWKNN